ncbi:MAG: hypothetical protein IT196_13350 [Acidimicrobiales bacterium]|nr:hypothetical protein [Acidimicrobiales bacterium]
MDEIDVDGRPDPEAELVIIRVDEARLILHALAAFERLLRHGGLTQAQLPLLLPPGAGPADPRADSVMAEVVVECGEPLRRQVL